MFRVSCALAGPRAHSRPCGAHCARAARPLARRASACALFYLIWQQCACGASLILHTFPDASCVSDTSVLLSAAWRLLCWARQGVSLACGASAASAARPLACPPHSGECCSIRLGSRCLRCGVVWDCGAAPLCALRGCADSRQHQRCTAQRRARAQAARGAARGAARNALLHPTSSAVPLQRNWLRLF